MNKYSVKELRENLIERIYGLGIDPKFKENPAFASAISQIENLISDMGMKEASNITSVSEENGKISFEYESTNGDKYTMSIECDSGSPETFKCVRTKLSKSMLDEKQAVENVVTINKIDGFITLTTYGSIFSKIDEPKVCNNSTYAEQKCYNTNGVMYKLERNSFTPYNILLEVDDRLDVNSMITPTLKETAFGGSIPNHRLESGLLLEREKLDTARVTFKDKTGIIYLATCPLNQDNGLRNMVVSRGYLNYEQDIVIPELSEEEIEAMIQRETNPKVREGLRKYAVGRSTYSYNSAEDKDFIRDGIRQSKGISR